MISETTLADGLQSHLDLCGEILALVERESRTLHEPDSPTQFETLQQKRALLVRLTQSSVRLAELRAAWQRLSAAERAQKTGVIRLMRQNQDLIMRIVVLDRENEQALLRRGLVPPRHLPPANRQRPHYVAELYRRNGV